jgi:hypothetical protein
MARGDAILRAQAFPPGIKLLPACPYIQEVTSAKRDPNEGEGMEFQRFSGKVAVVTSAGSGIGAATARRFCEKGANVVLVGRTQAKLAKIAEDLDQKRALSRLLTLVNRRTSPFSLGTLSPASESAFPASQGTAILEAHPMTLRCGGGQGFPLTL